MNIKEDTKAININENLNDISEVKQKNGNLEKDLIENDEENQKKLKEFKNMMNNLVNSLNDIKDL